MVTPVPSLPLIFCTASSVLIFIADSSSMATILSPALTPALSAGVPLRGATTVNTPLAIPISIPTPPKLPLISSSKTLDSTGGKNTV